MELWITSRGFGVILLAYMNETRPLTAIEIVVTVLVIAFAVQFFILSKKEAGPPPSLAEAIKSGDLSQCGQIVNGSDRLQCQGALQMAIFSRRALEENDPKICLNIADEFLRERCKDPFRAREAIAKKDVSLCPSTKDAKGDTVFFDKKCPGTIYLNLAIEKKDTAVCKKITEKSMSEICVASVKSGVPPTVSIFGVLNVGTSAEKITPTIAPKILPGPFGAPN